MGNMDLSCLCYYGGAGHLGRYSRQGCVPMGVGSSYTISYHRVINRLNKLTGIKLKLIFG